MSLIDLGELYYCIIELLYYLIIYCIIILFLHGDICLSQHTYYNYTSSHSHIVSILYVHFYIVFNHTCYGLFQYLLGFAPKDPWNVN